jgi:hypothetical protein
MIKIPQARAKAAEASLPTLVDEGKLFLRMRRTQASGGSNSTAEGGGVVSDCDLSVVATVVVPAAAVVSAATASVVASVVSIASVGSAEALMVWFWGKDQG